MKLQKTLLVLTFLSVLFQSSFGQEKPKPELVNDMGKENCESYWSRFDSFFNLLQNDPTSIGYIIIYGKKNSLPNNLFYEKLTDGIIKFRNLDRSRFVIIHGEEGDDYRIQFWKVPKGAESPIFVKGNWDLRINQNKPFVLRGFSEGDGICPTYTSVKLFADYLTANPNSRANIIVTDKTTGHFANTKRAVINQLVRNYNISPNRVKFFYVKNKDFVNEFYDLEYWIIPQNKR